MAQRSAYGCIEKAGTNRWRVRWWGDMHDGKGYRRCSKTIHGSRKDARLYLSQMQTAHHEDAPGVTIGDVFERWYWPRAEKTLSKNSLINYKSAWNRVRDKWENRLVTDVHPIEIQEWLLTLTASQTKRALGLLRPVMEYAVRYEMIPANPFKVRYDTNRPSDKKKGVIERDKGIYTLDECAALVNAAKDSPLRVAIILAAFGSCRVGESLAPTGADVQAITASNGMLCAAVAITAQVNNSGTLEYTLKNEQSERTVIIPEPFSKIVIEAAKRAGTGLLTHNGLGEPVTDYYRRSEWKRICKSAGLPCYLLRNLRNSWRTYMRWTLGADLEHVEHLMGHAGNSISDKHYVRPTTEQLVETVSMAFEKWENLGNWDK
ncbi:hypothetical protein K6V98_08155 [Collinsella sp. AGMB00827]|uniref:Site-specific integrase n=1 Tax=Collinsella ureilytica TaxID=2869515 RepID=A0ABS7MLS9_9ACTN|nr:hypothetical protein [Collinsella urealyticum]MBY4798316.1 hypothetical protein [Collinsella urealyticum]